MMSDQKPPCVVLLFQSFSFSFLLLGPFLVFYFEEEEEEEDEVNIYI